MQSDVQNNENHLPVDPGIQTDKEREYVDRLCGLLPADNEASGIAKAILRGEPQAGVTALRLIHILDNPTIKIGHSPHYRRWAYGWGKVNPVYIESELVCWALGRLHLPPDLKRKATDVLIATLYSQRQGDWNIGNTVLGRGCLRGVLWTVPFTLLGALLIAPCFSSPYFAGFAAMMAGILGLVGGQMFSISLAFHQNRKHLNALYLAAATALGRQPVVESMDVLAQFLCREPVELHYAAAKALKSVLPLLTAEHYGRLPGRSVGRLADALYDFQHIEMDRYLLDDDTVLVFLVALEKVGTASAIPGVRYMAQHRSRLDVRQLAERVLQVLEERVRQETDRETLLRGSHSVARSGVDVLLRPAQSQPDIPPEELLRPHIGQGEKEERT